MLTVGLRDFDDGRIVHRISSKEVFTTLMTMCGCFSPLPVPGALGSRNLTETTRPPLELPTPCPVVPCDVSTSEQQLEELEGILERQTQNHLVHLVLAMSAGGFLAIVGKGIFDALLKRFCSPPLERLIFSPEVSRSVGADPLRTVFVTTESGSLPERVVVPS